MFVGLAKSTLLCFVILINLIFFYVFTMIRRGSAFNEVELGSHYTNRTFYVFLYFKNYISPQGEDLPTVQRRYTLCYSYVVWLCGFYYGAFYVESCLVLFAVMLAL